MGTDRIVQKRHYQQSGEEGSLREVPCKSVRSQAVRKLPNDLDQTYTGPQERFSIGLLLGSEFPPYASHVYRPPSDVTFCINDTISNLFPSNSGR